MANLYVSFPHILPSSSYRLPSTSLDFCANFSKPATTMNTWFYPYIQLIPHEDPVVLRPYYDIVAGDNLAIGALFSWDYEEGEELEVESRVGVSFLSAEKA